MPKLSTCPAAWRVDHLNEVARLEAVKPFEHAQVGDCIKTATPDTLSHFYFLLSLNVSTKFHQLDA